MTVFTSVLIALAGLYLVIGMAFALSARLAFGPIRLRDALRLVLTWPALFLLEPF